MRLLNDDDSLQGRLKNFDAAKACCFLDADRQHLLAVIESGFGSFAPFNASCAVCSRPSLLKVRASRSCHLRQRMHDVVWGRTPR